MMFVDQQLHGYRQGHQLLSASVKLSKSDQDLVDRLSDVAGPLRPGELFEPYLTCYPLHSGSHYVLARTWQDIDAPRAGCVRTRSMIVSMQEWMTGADILELVSVLSMHGPSEPAERVQIKQMSHPFPHVDVSQGVELVEALFLEDRKPIVVFEASSPEGVTVRLLAALWPSLRRTFAVSTFTLSPRTLGGRSFDLVFAPKDARPRFSDWPGRRIDARKSIGSRHRWSNKIVERVFGSNTPSLIGDDSLGELFSENSGTETEFRISLLWHELYEKLKTSPNAALGLLDIANSRSTRNIDAIKRLEPELGLAAQRAAESWQPADAWRFLLALTDKLRDIRLRLSAAKAIRGAAIRLASRAPIEAISNVDMLAAAHGHELLLGAIGDGVAHGLNNKQVEAIIDLEPCDFIKLLILSPAFAEELLTHHPASSKQLAIALSEAPMEIRCDAKRRLLRLLVDDQQAEAARILIAELDRDELLAYTRLLSAVNDLAAESLCESLVEQARTIGAISDLRETVAMLPVSQGSDALLLRLVAPVQIDLEWLMETTTLDDDRRLNVLHHLLHLASAVQFKLLVTGPQRDSILQLLMQDPASNADIVDRVLEHNTIDPLIAVNTTIRLLPHASDDCSFRLASRALEIILPRDIGADRDAALDTFLGAMGSNLIGSRIVRCGLKREVPGDVVAGNLAAFNRSPPTVRQRIMLAVEELANALVARGTIDYPESAVADAASLLWDSASLSRQMFLRSCAILLPFLLRSRHEPASPLIAVAFPSVYSELRRVDDEPNLFGLFVLFEWDRRKSARRDLVDAFMHSNWRATDIALAAARAGDSDRILRHIAKYDDGARIIASIKRNIALIPDPWNGQVRESLHSLRDDE